MRKGVEATLKGFRNDQQSLAFLKRFLSPERLRHSEAVAVAAGELAGRFGASGEQAELAGLLHDCARDLGPHELLGLAAQYQLVVEEIEKREPILLHGPVGALLVQEELGIEDKEVLNAIKNHTLGAPGMGLLEKIIYVADFIAEGRCFPGVAEIRSLAQENLDQALLAGFAAAVCHCLKRKMLIHPQTIAAWNFYINQYQYQTGGK